VPTTTGAREHEALAQSSPDEHFFPSAHAAQFTPPQSMSASPALSTPSMHVAAWQSEEVQTLARQSVGSEQPFPFSQGRQTVPPQSASVSSPF
jgi:hypothetical protein